MNIMDNSLNNDLAEYIQISDSDDSFETESNTELEDSKYRTATALHKFPNYNKNKIPKYNEKKVPKHNEIKNLVNKVTFTSRS